MKDRGRRLIRRLTWRRRGTHVLLCMPRVVLHGVVHAGFDASFSASGWLLPPFFFVKFIITSVKVNSSFI